MNKRSFRKFLEDWGVAEVKIEPHISIAEKFEDFLKGSNHVESPTPDDITAFSKWMIEEKLNTYDNYVGVALYGRFLGRMDIRNAVVALLDGAEAMGNLYDKVEAELGPKKRDAIFAEVEVPPLGSPNTQKPKVTQVVMERLESAVGEEGTKALLSDCLRDLEDDWFLENRKKYLESSDFDEFLKMKGDDFIDQLEKIKQEDGFYFNQKITDEVIQYVESNPEIRQGVREGNILYETKIPYMTIEYLAETDEDMRRYYYCHCPWVRESLRMDDVEVSPTFCNCSAGFHKKYYEVVLDQPLKAEVLETVLAGDLWCRFAIHLPEGL
jgi:hypothetical protein